MGDLLRNLGLREIDLLTKKRNGIGRKVPEEPTERAVLVDAGANSHHRPPAGISGCRVLLLDALRKRAAMRPARNAPPMKTSGRRRANCPVSRTKVSSSACRT